MEENVCTIDRACVCDMVCETECVYDRERMGVRYRVSDLVCVRERALERGGERHHIPHMNMCVSRRAYDMVCQCLCGRMCADDRMRN